MFKDVLLPAMAGDLSDAAVDSACALAQTADGRVVALVGVSVFVPTSAEWVRYPLATFSTLHEAASAALAEQVRNVDARLQRQSVAHEVIGSHAFWLAPEEVLAPYGPAVDVIVLDARHTQDDRGRRLFAGALTGSGRPVLLVPVDAPVRTAGKVLVAWKRSAEAGHALHEALPLLRLAERVEVVVVGDTGNKATAEGDGCTRLLTHLERHGVKATLAQVARTGTTGATIAHHAIGIEADLIVAGGYSRPRTLEQVFGGVTRHLLEHAPVPVLFSH